LVHIERVSENGGRKGKQESVCKDGEHHYIHVSQKGSNDQQGREYEYAKERVARVSNLGRLRIGVLIAWSADLNAAAILSRIYW
jgi:hypothetical protein